MSSVVVATAVVGGSGGTIFSSFSGVNPEFCGVDSCAAVVDVDDDGGDGEVGGQVQVASVSIPFPGAVAGVDAEDDEAGC